MPVTNQSGEAAAVVLILQYPDRQIVYRTYERVERNNPYNFTLTTIPGSGVPVSSKISYKAKSNLTGMLSIQNTIPQCQEKQ